MTCSNVDDPSDLIISDEAANKTSKYHPKSIYDRRDSALINADWIGREAKIFRIIKYKYQKLNISQTKKKKK